MTENIGNHYEDLTGRGYLDKKRLPSRSIILETIIETLDCDLNSVVLTEIRQGKENSKEITDYNTVFDIAKNPKLNYLHPAYG